MSRFAADYFDGQTSRAHPVRAAVEAGQLHVQGENIEFAFPLDRIQVAPPAGQARGVVHLPDARELHSADHAALLELSRLTASARPERWAHLLESRLRYALAALVVAVLIVFVGLRWGMPAVALLATHTLPAGLDSRIGEESLALMDKISLSPSTLPAARQRALAHKLDAQCRQQACPPYRLLFRDSRLFGANAMALPGGAVVMTDALVSLSHDDEEVLAVIAHELGHVQHRHSLRLALQSIGAGVLLVAITGDIGSFSDLAAGLPSLLLQSGYSRDMEREADAYALRWLNAACIPPRRFADILGRLDKAASDKTNLLDSHPGTRERIAPFLASGSCT
ncbi:MAG TPA: M48 family metallopeptidase [Thiobacillus sp.]|nr:M48 family metallopeptidase [Thiobacillus sp.]